MAETGPNEPIMEKWEFSRKIGLLQFLRAEVDFVVSIVSERGESEVSHTFYGIAKSFFVVILCIYACVLKIRFTFACTFLSLCISPPCV